MKHDTLFKHKAINILVGSLIFIPVLLYYLSSLFQVFLLIDDQLHLQTSENQNSSTYLITFAKRL